MYLNYFLKIFLVKNVVILDVVWNEFYNIGKYVISN